MEGTIHNKMVVEQAGSPVDLKMELLLLTLPMVLL
jgi:hypothetical protein